MPAMPDDISALALPNESHAIHECSFTLTVSPETKIGHPEELRRLHDGQMKVKYPKFDKIDVVEARLSGASLQQAHDKPRSVGFQFKSFKRDGNLSQAFRGQNEPESWLVVNILEYDNWTSVFESAMYDFRIFADDQKHISINGVQLHYIDYLFWNSSKDLPFSAIFKPDSNYLPEAIIQSDIWHNQMGFSNTDKSGNREIVNVRVKVEEDHQKHKKITIDVPIKRIFAEPISLTRIVETDGIAENSFRELHKYNKDVMDNLLTDPVQQLIGLRE